MAQVEWTEQAIDELDAACEYISLSAPRSADALAVRITHAVSSLSAFPRSGRIVPEADRDSVRELIISNYRVIYRITGDLVEVFTIHHGSRPIPNPNLL